MEIVSGIQQFERAFAPFSDSFIVIGGSACRAVLSDGPIHTYSGACSVTFPCLTLSFVFSIAKYKGRQIWLEKSHL